MSNSKDTLFSEELVRSCIVSYDPGEFIPVDQWMPVTGIDVIGLNIKTGQMEFGFRSTEDTRASRWLDFSFPLTHWMYYRILGS